MAYAAKIFFKCFFPGILPRHSAGQRVQGSGPPASVRDTREIAANPRRKFNSAPPFPHKALQVNEVM